MIFRTKYNALTVRGREREEALPTILAEFFIVFHLELLPGFWDK